MIEIIPGLTPKEIVELRIQCLAPYVTIASKTDIMQDVVLARAEAAWKYAVQPLMQRDQGTTVINNEIAAPRPQA